MNIHHPISIWADMASTPQRRASFGEWVAKWPWLLDVFAAGLDPARTYGVQALQDAEPHIGNEDHTPAEWRHIRGVLDLLAARKSTGNDARARVAALADRYPHWQFLIRCIFESDFHCGITWDTLVKGWPERYQKFACMLAKDHKSEFMAFPFAVEPKMDGMRLIAVCQYAETKLYTRTGKSMDHLAGVRARVSKLWGRGAFDFVLDGELYDGEGFESTISLARSNKDDNSDRLGFWIFDCLYADSWLGRRSGEPYHIRRQRLSDMLYNPLQGLNVVEKYNVHNEEEFYERWAQFRNDGYEGLMAKPLDSIYVWKRSDLWQKYKDILTFDARIVAVGKGTGKYKGKLGWLEVQGEYEGAAVATKVGGGFSDGQRDAFWAGRSKLKGRMVEVQCQEITPDGAARFPVFLRFRDDRA